MLPPMALLSSWPLRCRCCPKAAEDHLDEALLGLVPEASPNVEFIQEVGTASDELIVGLIDSFSIGDSDGESMEDPAGDAADGNGADGNEADGDMEDRHAAMNGIQQMGQRLH